VLFRSPGADSTNQFTLTASSTDAQSGVSYSFPHIAGFTESPGAGPGEERYVASSPTAGDGGSGTVTATNGVGTASAGGFSFTIVVDGSGPTGGAFTTPAADTYSTDGHASVTWNAFTDGGSGMSTLTIRRQLTTLTANACDAPSFADDATFAVTLTTASTSIPPEAGLTSARCFRYVTTATDHLGNVTTKTSNAFLVDLSAPATPTLSTLTKTGANVFVSGSTVYFKPGADATNTFTASATTTGDPETGVDNTSWAFAAIPGFGAAAPAGSAGETYTAAAPTAAQGGSGSATVQNNAGSASSAGAAFSVVADDTAPSGGSFSGVPQYSGNGSVSFSMTLFGDGSGAGLATQAVQRQSAAPTGSSCPVSGWTNDGAPTAPAASFSATGLVSGTCYRWLFDATDNVGNAATTVIGGPTLVDTAGPSAPALVIDNAANAYVNGSTIYYDPGTGGSVRVTATSTPSASGIGAYTYNESALLSHGFTRGGAGNQAILSFNVGASDAVGSVTATSNSGVTSAATNFSLVGDPTGPSAPTLTCAPASCTSNTSVSVDLTANGDGSGSGVREIRYTIDGSDPTASSTLYSGTFSVGTAATIKAAAIDNLGHIGAITTQAITVDATPPHATTTDVSGTSMNIHFDKLLVPSEIPATSAFAVSVTANGATVADNVTNVAISGATVTLTLATAIANAQTAAVTYTKPGLNQLQDSFANYVATFTQTATLDVTAPSALSAAASGTTFTLQFDEPLNGGSVPATSAFAVTMTAGGSPSSNAITAVAVSGSMVTLTLTNPVSGYQTAAVSYTQPASNRLGDLAGNDTAAFTKTVTLDTTAPHATAGEVNGNSLIVHFDEALAGSVPPTSAFAVSLGGLSVSVNGLSISGSDVTLTLGAAATGGQSVSLAYTQPASNKLQDAAANATPSFSLAPTNMTSGGSGVVPKFTSATPADGTTQPSVAGPVALVANEYVAWSNLGVTYTNLAGDAGTWQPLTGGTAQTLSLPISATAPGLYTVNGTISDGVTSTNFVTHFTVWSAGSGELPRPTAKTALAGASGSLTTADQKQTVTWPATVVPATPGDGLVIEMAPQNPAAVGAPAGTTWSAGGVPVEITARTILTKTPVTTFADPLVLTFPSASPTDIPLVSSDNGATWRFVSPCDAPGALPDGAKDCYAFSGGVLTVWTLHLTLFALVGDHQPPTAPQKLGVGISSGQIVMRWEPATDNTGQIQSYTVFVDGQPAKVLGGKTYEYYAGLAAASDTHVYRVQATDGSGNAGPLSDAWTGVPDLRGLSQVQARDVLGSRGFSVGTIANAGSGGGVAAQNPTVPAYAPVGSAVSFTLSTAVRTPLAMHVVGTRRLNLATRDYAAVRVQVNLGATIDASLAANGRNLATWTRTVKPGTWILRYTLPAGLAPGAYKLNVSARTATDRRAATIRLELKHGQVLLGGKARVLVVGGSSHRATLALHVPKAKVMVTPDTKVWDTTFWSRNVAVVVVDLDRQGLALVHNLHTVFPSVRIVAVTKNPAKVVQARRFGASAVVLSGRATSQLVSATISALLGRV